MWPPFTKEIKMIVRKSEYETERVIDLTGPEGNAFCLLGLAKKWAEQLGKDVDTILDEMKSGDYDNLVEVFDREFGCVVTLLR